jgi:CheY-like chemotaxis protein
VQTYVTVLGCRAGQSVFSRKIRNRRQNGPYGLQASLYFEIEGRRYSFVGHHTVPEGNGYGKPVQRCFPSDMPIQILIADDNPTVRTALRQLLEGAKFGEVIDVENGKEAIQKALELRPNLIILDLVMPVMDGLTAARELSKVIPGIPVLMHTMHWSQHVELEAQKVGVRKVVAKGDSTGLVSAIQEILAAAPSSAETGATTTVVPATILPNETTVVAPVVGAEPLTVANPQDDPAGTTPDAGTGDRPTS